MTKEIINTEDVIDSRDVIERIEDLESMIEDNEEEAEEDQEDLTEEKEELKILKTLAEEASGSPDWPHGEVLIRHSHFEEYAQELAEDIGAINRNMAWPNNCIDWEQATRELQMDYMLVDFDGVEYWIRA